MENASKALIIAGGVLLGIIITSLFAYEMFSVSQTGKAYQEKINQEDIYEFNVQFTKYINKNISAQDIVSILNFVYEWNINNQSDSIEVVSIQKPNNGSYTYITDFNNYSKNQVDNLNTEILSKFGVKEYDFKLNIIGYDELGRVNKISIGNTKANVIKYKVTFYANGGSVSTSSREINAGNAIRKPSRSNMAWTYI